MVVICVAASTINMIIYNCRNVEIYICPENNYCVLESIANVCMKFSHYNFEEEKKCLV